MAKKEDTLISVHANSKMPGATGLQGEGGERGEKVLGAAASHLRYICKAGMGKEICGGPGMLSVPSML